MFSGVTSSQPQNDSSDCNPFGLISSGSVSRSFLHIRKWPFKQHFKKDRALPLVLYPVLIKHPWSGLLWFDSDCNRTACRLQSASCAFLQKQYCSSVNSCWLNKNRQHPHFHSLLCSLNEKKAVSLDSLVKFFRLSLNVLSTLALPLELNWVTLWRCVLAATFETI